MTTLKLRQTLQQRGLTLLEHGDGWLVTNTGTAKTLIEHEFDTIANVETWVEALPNRHTDEDAEYSDFVGVNQCDGCRRGMVLTVDGDHIASAYDRIGCTRDRYIVPRTTNMWVVEIDRLASGPYYLRKDFETGTYDLNEAELFAHEPERLQTGRAVEVVVTTSTEIKAHGH